MGWLLGGAVGLLGLTVGSFLNVVIHRVPQNESIVRPRSRCPRCATEIRPLDNIPVVSWLLLGGCCRACSESIPARYPAVELGTALLFLCAFLRFGATIELAAYLVLFAALISISAIDIDVRRIPKSIVWPVMAVGMVLLGSASLMIGRPGLMLDAAGGALGAFAALFLIHLISPRGMGFGDVRLAALLGLFLGWLGPAHVPLGLFLAFAGGGFAGVVALLAGRSRKSALPFGPFLAGGTVAAVLFGRPILLWYLGGG